MSELKVLDPAGKTEEKSTRSFKRLTCMTKTEEFLTSAQPGVIAKRYCFSFATLKNDMGFGASTGDLVESIVVYSMEPNRFETGKKYEIELKAV